MPWLSRITPTTKEYQRYRNVGRELNHTIIDAYVNVAIIEKAAKMLGLGKRRQLILDSEDDLSVLMDFSLYEVRQKDRKNQVERYADERGGSNFVERDLLSQWLSQKPDSSKLNEFSKIGITLLSAK